MDYFLFDSVDEAISDVCGCAMLNPGWKHIRRRMESETVLIFGRKNSALIDDEENHLEVRPGRVVLLPAGRTHAGAREIAEPVSYYWVHFRLREAPKRMDEIEARAILASPPIARQRLERAALLPQTMDVGDADAFDTLFRDLLVAKRKPSYGPLAYQLRLRELLVALTEECVFQTRVFQTRAAQTPLPNTVAAGTHVAQFSSASHAEGSVPGLVDTILMLIEDELSNPDLSVKRVAARLALHPDYAGRRFRETMGISLGRYVAKRRVELASARLRETAETSESIALHCGFGSARRFVREFKQATGQTPAAYRLRAGDIDINAL
jgi:AraC-like DNA-binding protein